MLTTTSTTRWLDQQVVPDNYDDVPALVNLAREARERQVEFDWVFAEEDLRSLQRAVFEWGTGVRGRYKCFDARVLAAINEALGDKDTAFTLNEPKNMAGLRAKASCFREDDLYHLQGHATFDLVFGYARTGLENGPGTIHLTQTARQSLSTSVEPLGWALHRLVGRWPFWYALFGLPPNYDEPIPSQRTGAPATNVEVHFHGPFSSMSDAGCRCLLSDPIAEESGIYLWTIPIEGTERAWYVGQTRRSFWERTAEHVADYLSGRYPVYDVDALLRGEYRWVLTPPPCVWPETLPAFLANHDRLLPNIMKLIRLIRIHCAPLDGNADLHNRIEGAIGRHYKDHPEPALRGFFTPGIKVPAAIPGDKPIRLLLSSETPIAGLPTELLL